MSAIHTAAATALDAIADLPATPEIAHLYSVLDEIAEAATGPRPTWFTSFRGAQRTLDRAYRAAQDQLPASPANAVVGAINAFALVELGFDDVEPEPTPEPAAAPEPATMEDLNAQLDAILDVALAASDARIAHLDAELAVLAGTTGKAAETNEDAPKATTPAKPKATTPKPATDAETDAERHHRATLTAAAQRCIVKRTTPHARYGQRVLERATGGHLGYVTKDGLGNGAWAARTYRGVLLGRARTRREAVAIISRWAVRHTFVYDNAGDTVTDYTYGPEAARAHLAHLEANYPVVLHDLDGGDLALAA